MKRRKIRKNKLIGLLAFLFLATLGIYLFLRSDYFNLNQVVITNNNHLSKSEVKKLMSINLNRNIFSYSLNEIESKISKSPYVESCKIKRQIPNKVIVEITEKQIIGPIYNSKEYCYIDYNGNLIEEVDDTNKEKIIINMEYTIEGKEIIINKSEKDALIKLIKGLESENILKNIYEINMLDKSLINMKTVKGLEINIKNNDDIEGTIKKLQQVLVDLQTRKKYSGKIDMTYSNYILYES